MERAIRISVSLIGAIALGCGGGAATQPRETRAAEPEPVAVVEPVAEPVAQPEPDPEPEPIAEPEPEPEPEPPPEPVTAETEEAIHQVLRTATFEIGMLRRLMDPAWGLGTYDAGDTGIVHHCDPEEVANHPGVSFAVNEGDAFDCDRDLERCTSQAPDGDGYSFYFRRNGDRIHLNAVVHHRGRVPRTDPRPVRSWVEGGEGVCDLWRAMRAQEPAAPQRFSLFISEQTGLVPELVDAHHCGDEAAAAYRERSAALAGAPSLTCTRDPARCTFTRGDEEVTVYGGADGVTAIAITRPGMFPDLERAQRRDLDRFLRTMRDHACE